MRRRWIAQPLDGYQVASRSIKMSPHQLSTGNPKIPSKLSGAWALAEPSGYRAMNERQGTAGADVSMGARAADREPPEESDFAAGFFRFHGMWAPGVRLFRRLQFSAKACCITTAFMVPPILLSWSCFSAKSQVVTDTRAERNGVLFARELLPAIKHARQLRRFSMVAASTGKEPGDLDVVRRKLAAAVQELDNVTPQNAALVEETAAAAASLSEQARGLASEVDQFKLPGLA
jgi:hypothetical protein